jgi:hypothetical protein
MSNAKWKISQLYRDKSKQVVDETMMKLYLYKTITLAWIMAVFTNVFTGNGYTFRPFEHITRTSCKSIVGVI